MPTWASVLVGLAAGIVAVWAILVLVLWRSGAKVDAREAIRLLPDTARLVTRLARDRSLPYGVRVRLWRLVAYLASPIDIIPDFIPVIGYADDVVVIVLVLRSVVRRSGSEVVAKHWPGSAEGLDVVLRVTGG